jgi:hypothetical protein
MFSFDYSWMYQPQEVNHCPLCALKLCLFKSSATIRSVSKHIGAALRAAYSPTPKFIEFIYVEVEVAIVNYSNPTLVFNLVPLDT